MLSLCKLLMAHNQEITAKLDFMTQQLALAQHQRYGRSSEKSNPEDGVKQLSFCFNEAEVQASSDVTEPTIEDIIKKPARTKKQKGKRQQDLSDFPVERIEHKLSEEACSCPHCSSPLKVINRELSNYMKFVPAHFENEEHVVYVYGCTNCECDHIERAEKEKPLLRGSVATPSVVAAVINGKYVNSVPLARQEKEFQRYGVNLSRQTMANWIIRCTEDYLSLLYDALREELLSCPAIQCDETRVQVIKEDGRPAESDSWMWIYRTGELTEQPPIVLYNYQMTRQAQHPKTFLSGYKGYLTCDGYAAYHSMSEDIVVSGCMAHVRRKFNDCLVALPAKDRKGTVAEEALKRLALLYKIEDFLETKTEEERREGRLQQSKPILEAFFEWLKPMEVAADSQSLIGKAVKYALNQQTYLETYLLNGLIPIDNNAAERAAKAFAVGRNNWMFCYSPNGAKASSIIYSIVETAKANGLRPYEYFSYLLETIPQYLDGKQREFIKDLMPWSSTLPDRCRSNKK
ncbi:transposase [Desulfosporosinus youngiae DSM 17734]|uniref:Transposase n=1 Tax=Desulfosporosinus youngiae DSM 17734 TaxID=768710 RepID=H5XVP3_9FIRM|nr:transposase [Desulfosporosinus youngiae DSM 17734]